VSDPLPASDVPGPAGDARNVGWRRAANAVLTLAAVSLYYLDGHYVAILAGLAVFGLGAAAARLAAWRFLALSLAFFAGAAVYRWARVPWAYQNILPQTALVLVAFAFMEWRDLRGTVTLPRWRRALWLVPVVAIASCAAMHFWLRRLPQCRLSAPYRELPRWVLWMGMPAFVVANALCEELLMRVAALGALRRTAGTSGAVLLQAAAFGLWHWVGGMPDGPAGAAMAFAFGAALGAIRVATRSVWPCVVAHGVVSIYMGVVFLSRATTWFGTVRWWPLLGGMAAVTVFVGAAAFAADAAVGLRRRP